MKDAKRTSFAEFDKWFSKDGSIIPVAGDAGYEGYVERRKAWKAALKWIKYADALEPSLANALIDEELKE